MSGDNMQKFISVLVCFGMGCAGLLAVVLAAVAILLIWRPRVLTSFLRYALAGTCLLSAGGLGVGLVRMAWAEGAENNINV